MNIPNELYLKQMEIGPMENFIYFIGDKNTRQIAVVDPAWDVEHLRDQANREGLVITHILLTHGHPDHVNGLKDLLSTYDVPVFISKHEAPFFTPDCPRLQKVEDGAIIQIGNIPLKCVLTPGHSPGCQCFSYKNILIVGDTVFIDGCGRCDLPGGDPKKMYQSLQNVILKFPDDTLLFPGHNYGSVPCATLAEQKKNNPYLMAADQTDFVRHRMGM